MNDAENGQQGLEELRLTVAELMEKCRQLEAQVSVMSASDREATSVIDSHADGLGGIERRLLRIERLLAEADPKRIKVELAGSRWSGAAWAKENRRVAKAESRVSTRSRPRELGAQAKERKARVV
jgi:hypothetical protein